MEEVKKYEGRMERREEEKRRREEKNSKQEGILETQKSRFLGHTQTEEFTQQIPTLESPHLHISSEVSFYMLTPPPAPHLNGYNPRSTPVSDTLSSDPNFPRNKFYIPNFIYPQVLVSTSRDEFPSPQSRKYKRDGEKVFVSHICKYE
ncbi:hypothetical protein BCON_0033g00180 [Botryotinia convoluta]|uniref:Uncharacterized protein n=1 Tax=Botryotinia convoluta TaxID=54673 RepID=A0A4Z1IH80_9HELO|nr:hypothetical protein BCON_0033g00180 [Botryotinia convoluta]